MKCPYCKAKAELVGGERIYPHRKDLYSKKFYLCAPCDARVGCHDDGRPFGSLANAGLRKLRSEAHAAFDPLWKEGNTSRKKAYEEMSNYFGMEIHIGESNKDMCKNIIKYSLIKRKENGTDYKLRGSTRKT